jgi:transposase-like protein
LQRYRCQTCKRTFNALTGTSLARLRKKDNWLDFSRTLVESKTLRQGATALGVHRNTTLRWRHRFLRSIKDDRVPKLQGITEADETYFFES